MNFHKASSSAQLIASFLWQLVYMAVNIPMTGFFICGGGGGGICSLLVQKLGDKPLCKLSQVLLRLRKVPGESVAPVSVFPAYEGGLLRNFFSGVEQPF